MIRQFTLLVAALGFYVQLQAQQRVPEFPVNGNNTSNKTYGCVLKTGAKANKNTVGDISNAPRPTRAEDVYTLPVVFHHIHSNKTPSLSVPVAQEYIDILNRDFSLKNKRFIAAKAATKIPPYFLDVAADTKIQFCLAHTDKEGKTTSGIVDKRINGFAPVYFSVYSDKLYDDKLGGSTLWPQDKYINIYIVENLDNKDLAGYANSKGLALEQKDASEANHITHEMGHYLGLQHPWSSPDDKEEKLNINCDKSDGIDDTPVQEGPSWDHPDYDQILDGFEGYFTQLFSCNNDKDGGNQFLNFMDYTAFRMFFTAGQKAKMRSFIEDNFPGLKNNGKCEVGVCANDEYDQKADNKDFDHATEITPEIAQNVNGVATYGNYKGLLCQNDVDVYKFKGIKGNKVGVSGQHTYQAFDEVDIYKPYMFKPKFELFKKNGNDYTPIKKEAESSTDYFADFFVDEVQKGDEEYYLKVSGLTKNDYHSYVGYELSINNRHDPETTLEGEYEDKCNKIDKNQTPFNATLLTQPETIQEWICSGQDIDYYKIYLEGDGNDKNMSNIFNVTLDGLTSDIDMTIFSAAGNKNIEYGLNEQSIISTTPKQGIAKEVQYLNVPPGWYYIEIKPKPGVGISSYSLTVDFGISFEQGVDNDLNCQHGAINGEIKGFEPNETLDDPTVIKPSADNMTTYYIKDYICPSNDTDVYEVTLDGILSDITIHLFGDGDYNDLPRDYDVNLVDAKTFDVIQFSATVGNDWEKILAHDIKAGKYFVSVFAKNIYTHNGQVPYYLNVYVTKLDGNKINQNDLPIVSLYPNPPKNNVTINISNNLTTKNAEMTITDLYGKVMVTKIVEFVNGKLLNPFSVVNYTKGLYSVKIKDKGNVYYTKFLID